MAQPDAIPSLARKPGTNAVSLCIVPTNVPLTALREKYS
jgi:hypothetical protein